ncbi:MAG: hypothetical protein M1399_04080 [Actinobacteria bacterium]|nr:hypothetical protein [Actinomycetota bacterium]
MARPVTDVMISGTQPSSEWLQRGRAQARQPARGVICFTGGATQTSPAKAQARQPARGVI